MALVGGIGRRVADDAHAGVLAHEPSELPFQNERFGTHGARREGENHLRPVFCLRRAGGRKRGQRHRENQPCDHEHHA
jgi:hypothetical protein